MRTHRKKFLIEKMAKLLTVSRSGYYASHSEVKENSLDKEIKTIFTEQKGRYGSPRIYALLQKKGIACSRYMVEKRMKAMDLYAGKKRRKPTTTICSKPSATDCLKRDFKAKKSNQKWCGDISYIPIKGGFVYLSVVMDLHSRKIVGWSMDNHMEQSLVLESLKKALKKRGTQEGLIFHTDRGSQYRAKQVQSLLIKNKIQVSQGSCAYDNAAMESFFGSMKTELLPAKKRFNSLSEAKLEMFEYIEIYYNKKRLHSTLDYMSPEEYEKTTMC